MAKNTSHSQKNPHAQTQNDKQSIWQSLFTLHLLKLKKLKVFCLRLPNSSRKSINHLFKNNIFESFILESVKIKSS